MPKFFIPVLAAATIACAAAAAAPPSFDEVYQLVRSNLTGVSPANLDRAALKGLLEQFPGQLMMEQTGSNGPASTAAVLGKTGIFNDAYAYIRVARVEGGLAERLRAAWRDLAETNKSKIKGLVLDLRFATGIDYAAASAAADCFLNTDQRLLDWGSASAAATQKTNAITAPLAVLVNSQTTGAAEALAAILREADSAVILGGATAGQANIYKDFALGDGLKLLIACAPVKLGDGTALARGLKPDIAVDQSLEDERAYLNDPYKTPPQSGASRTSSAALGSDSSVRATHRAANEASLVRQHRAGNDDDDFDDTDTTMDSDQPPPPVIADAALARALDLLKGIAVLQESHPG